jgi:hypothetical protein
MVMLLLIFLANGALLYLWIVMASDTVPSRLLWYVLAAAIGILSAAVLLYGGTLQGRGTQLVNTFIFVAPFLNVMLYETFVSNLQNARGTAAQKRKVSRLAGIVLVALTLVSTLVALTATRSSSRNNSNSSSSADVFLHPGTSEANQVLELGAANLPDVGVLI